MVRELGEFEVDLDGRFSAVRTSETNLGNFVCDVMVAATHADFALLNSGTLRLVRRTNGIESFLFKLHLGNHNDNEQKKKKLGETVHDLEFFFPPL